MDGRFISYLRVSTQAQGRSGLGLEAQRQAVLTYLGGQVLLDECVEIESGQNSDRPQLRSALTRCRQTGSTLVIARLDRLARNVRFIAGLMEEGVPFRACDMPNATPFMLHVYSAMAEEEARSISRRTRVALAAAKARGVKLGGYRGGPVPCAASAARARQAKADAFAARVLPVIQELQKQGLRQSAIARELGARGILTASGKGVWTATAVRNALAREANQ